MTECDWLMRLIPPLVYVRALGLNEENDGIIDYLLSKQRTRLDITAMCLIKLKRHIKLKSIYMDLMTMTRISWLLCRLPAGIVHDWGETLEQGNAEHKFHCVCDK